MGHPPFFWSNTLDVLSNVIVVGKIRMGLLSVRAIAETAQWHGNCLQVSSMSKQSVIVDGVLLQTLIWTKYLYICEYKSLVQRFSVSSFVFILPFFSFSSLLCLFLSPAPSFLPFFPLSPFLVLAPPMLSFLLFSCCF